LRTAWPQMLKTRHLTIRYPRMENPVIRDLSLHIQTGETVLLLSPSGGGKSTLAKALSGLIPQGVFAHTQGEIRLDDIDPLTAAPGKTAARIGLLFQDPEAGFATLAVADEIAFGLENLRISAHDMPAKIDAALTLLGLAGFHGRRLETLSGGEAQRLALASLLAMGPSVLVLDEPTANLDPAATRHFFRRLEKLQGQHTILLIEHKLEDCYHLADRVILLDASGALLACGEPDTVFKQFRQQIDAAGIWLPPFMAPVRPPRTDFPPLRDNPPAVTLSAVSFAYPHDEALFQDIELKIPQGDFLALAGENGTGKSTLAQLMIGLLPVLTGQVQLFGKAIETLSLAELTEQAGYVFQNPEHQFVANRVDEELAYSLRARHWSDDSIQARVSELLDRLGLQTHAAHNPFTLSQGQKRRLSVATMLAAGQRLLILDEPTFGQDRHTAAALMDSLSALNHQGTTVVMITHDMRLIREYARRVAVLDQGKLAFIGSPEVLFKRTELLRLTHLI